MKVLLKVIDDTTDAKCPKCRGTFNPNKEGDDLALHLYLTSLICYELICSNTNSRSL